MHEQAKLDEAKHFYDQMLKSLQSRRLFRINLSAFLSASRSVLQYAEKEAKTKQGGKTWYDDRISASSILRFFREKRNIEVHQEPTIPKLLWMLGLGGTIRPSGALSIIKKDAQGNILQTYSSQENQSSIYGPNGKTTVTRRYSFKDWSGNEDIPTLALMYLQELENFVKEGIQKGYLTP